MAGRSKVETALYESFVKGEINRPQQVKAGKMGLTQSIQVHAQNPDDGGAAQLIRALSSLSGDLQQYASRETDRNIGRQQSAAQKDYLNMTLEQRKALAESGQLQNYDPVYQAMFSRLWGEDISRNTADEITNKIRTGELKFGSNEELSKYLEERRKQDLANYGGNEYSLAGYNHHFSRLQREATNINSYLRGQEKRQNDLQLVQSQLLGVAKETNGNPDSLASVYRKLQAGGNFTDLEMHQRLAEVAQSLEKQGKVKELEALLGTQFSSSKEFGTLGQYLGDGADTLVKRATAENLRQRREAFEETYTDLRQAAHNGSLARFIGSKSADPKSIYGWLEKKGGRDLLEPVQIDSLIQMNANTIERQRAEAERNLARQQMASMRAQMEAQAIDQAMTYGRAGVTDQTYTDANGVTHVISAETSYKKAALAVNARLEKLVAEKKITPEQAFKEQLSFYGKGGVNEQWQDTLKFGVGAAALVVADPNNKGARATFDRAVTLYGQLKGSALPWLADNHVSGREKDILNLALAAQGAGQDPAQVVARAMNVDNPRTVSSKEVGKVIKDERLMGRATEIANMYANGLGMPVKDAIKKAQEDITGTYPKVNGTPVAPITRSLPPDRQEEVLNRLVTKSVEPLKPLGVDPSAVTLDTFNQASGFYTLRYKNGFAPVLDDKGQPMVITKKQMLEEVEVIETEYLKKHTSKAIPEDRGPGFSKRAPIDLSSRHGFENVKLPSVEIPNVSFNQAAPDLGVPRNKR